MTRLIVGHISMQSTDTARQQRDDAHKVFVRAIKAGYGWVTGTEANNAAVTKIFEEEAHSLGFRFARGGDVWIAVPQERVMPSTWETEFTQVVKGIARFFPTRGVLRVSFRDVEIGEVTVLASHLQTKRTTKKRPADNVKLAETIGRLAIQHGAGSQKVFYGGDQNLTDRNVDTFKGQPLLSCWDEMKVWPNTGHDNIDVIASYNGDQRVRCVAAQALDDAHFRLNTDHFFIEATFDVGVGPKPKPAPVKPAIKLPHHPEFKPPTPLVIGGHPKKNSGTGNHPVTRVVIHSAVMPCEPGRARQLASMNTHGQGGGSWHYAVDPVETIQCSFDSYVCWHAPPNGHSIGIEMADSPKPWPSGSLTKAALVNVAKTWRWRQAHYSKMLVRTAELTAELCLAYDLPLVYLGVKDLQAGKHGITIHANVSKAFHQSTHWDPGAWPRYRFMRLVKAHAKKLQS